MGKTVVITGSFGFVGKVLVQRLLSENWEIISIDSNTESFTSPGLKHFKVDLAQIEIRELSQLFQGNPVVHLASVSNSKLCEEHGTLAIDSNLKATLNIALAANMSNSNLIFASSEWIYAENPKGTEIQEYIKPEINQNTNMYAMTKIIGEWIVGRYCKKFIILRFGIIYGERKSPQSAFESIIFSAIQNEKITLGNKKTARRFIHVDDICSGIIRAILMFEGNSGTAYNLTGNELVSLEKIVKLASKILGKNLTIEETSETPSIRNPSSEIFKKIFGWEPEVSSLAGALQLFELYSGKRVQP